MMTAEPLPGSSSALYPGGLIEGPVWLDGSLYVSYFGGGTLPSGSILRYAPATGLTPVVADSRTNGLAPDPSGFVFAAAYGTGEVVRIADDGTRTPVASSYGGSRFNAPNDLVVRGDGTLYFTDPQWLAPMPFPQPVFGLYRVTPGGEVVLEDGSQENPNGITLSPDESWLYAGTPSGLVRYAVAADGSLGPAQPFAAAAGIGGVDGLAIDCAGNVYATVHTAGHVRVIAPDGTPWGTITVAASVTNAAFGGDDGRTLFITAGDPAAGDSIYAAELLLPGRPY